MALVPGGYLDGGGGGGGQMGLALLPGISMAPGGQDVGVIEDPTFSSSDILQWHVDMIRARQKEVDAAEETVRAKVAAVLAAAAATSGDSAAAAATDAVVGAVGDLTFGPSHFDEAARFYRETKEASTTGDDREGRPRKRRSRWEQDDSSGSGGAGSALALTGGAIGGVGGPVLPDAAAIKAHLMGIVAKHAGASGVTLGASDAVGPTPADSDDPEIVRQYARYTDVAQRLASGQGCRRRRRALPRGRAVDCVTRLWETQQTLPV
jgi:splicing factor 1